MNDFIIKTLNLKDEDLESIESIFSDNSMDYILTLKQKDHICPDCGCLTHAVKDYKIRPIKQKMFINFDSTIYYKTRRYLCKRCGKSFVENNPFAATRKKVTPSSIINILNDLKPYNATFSSVARTYGLSVGTIIDIFDKHVQISRKTLTKILCWDEFYFNRHSKYKYAFIMMDFHKKVILDILESRKSFFLDDYFSHISLEERQNVQYIIIDMYKNYKTIKTVYFKNAILVVDPFHAMKKVNDSLNSVRRRVMRKYGKDTLHYKLLKYRYRCLLKNRGELDFDTLHKEQILGYSITERDLTDLILNLSQTLKSAYRLKEDYSKFNQCIPESIPIKEENEKELNKIIKSMLESNIAEMQECAKTLNSWKEEILNSFVCIHGRRLSNGPIEGKNTYIKKIISNANGMNNFSRARNKFIYSQNQFERYSISEHKTKIKRKGSHRGTYKSKK